ncbi:hypothetical protein MASR2M15_26400 [Anaerolineales bacterium]
MNFISANSEGRRLVASGIYHYFLGGQDTGIRESWASYQLSDGSEIIRVERDAAAYRSRIALDIYQHDDQISKIEIQWQNQNPGLVQSAQAFYHFHADSLTISRVCDDHPYKETYQLPPGMLVSPLMRVTMGPLILKLVEMDTASVLIPDIRDAQNPGTLLSAHVEERQAKYLEADPIQIADQHYDTHRYQYTGDLYTEAAKFWVDPSTKILMRYAYPQTDTDLWVIELHHFQQFV